MGDVGAEPDLLEAGMGLLESLEGCLMLVQPEVRHPEVEECRADSFDIRVFPMDRKHVLEHASSLLEVTRIERDVPRLSICTIGTCPSSSASSLLRR